MCLSLFSNQVITFRSESFPNVHTIGKCRQCYFDLAGFRLSYSMKQSNLTWIWQTLKQAMGECFGWVCMPLPYTFSCKWHCFCNSCVWVLMHISDSNLNTLLNYQPHSYFGCYTAIISVLGEQNNTQLWFWLFFPHHISSNRITYILQSFDFWCTHTLPRPKPIVIWIHSKEDQVKKRASKCW